MSNTTMSISVDTEQIEQIEALAVRRRIQTGKNISRSEVVRIAVEQMYQRECCGELLAEVQPGDAEHARVAG
jgi:Arc/MetJ-type ribon-helix-helix transcriptional regulator